MFLPECIPLIGFRLPGNFVGLLFQPFQAVIQPNVFPWEVHNPSILLCLHQLENQNGKLKSLESLRMKVKHSNSIVLLLLWYVNRFFLASTEISKEEKTKKKATQSISLPMTVSLANIETEGTKVTVYKTKTVSQASVPRAQIPIAAVGDCDIEIQLV